MFLTVQATARCGACGDGGTPVNAAVPEVDCRGCGAAIPLGEGLWAAAFEDLARQAEDLAENARGDERYEQAGAALRVAFTREAPRCPHCEASWADVPDGGDWSCPSCHTPVPRRASAGALLVAEDRELLTGLAGERQPLALSCRGCGRPLTVGEERHVSCGSCEAQSVVPDEIWRRLNAPDAVARWFVRVGAEASDEALAGIGAQAMVVGPDGTLILVGSTPHLDFAVVAIDTATRTIRWTADVSDLDEWPIPAVLPDGTVVLACNLRRGLWTVGPDGLGPHVDTAAEVVDLTVHPGGGLMICTHPLQALERVTVTGQKQPLWPPAGCLARLFGMGGGGVTVAQPPKSRMRAAWPGRLGQGHDGDLRFAAGSQLTRFAADGTMRWATELPDCSVCIVAPCAASDGTTYAAYAVEDDRHELSEMRVVRVSGTGQVQGVVTRASVVNAIACEPDGALWVDGGDFVDGEGVTRRLQRFAPDGTLSWRGPV